MAADSETATVHVLQKSNYHVQTVQSIPISPDTLRPLPPNSLRVRSTPLALTTNNLSYANLGDALGWWHAWPVPSKLPAPYNDATQYGNCPAWGYATVLESTLPTVQAGQLLWGFFPLSTFPSDLTFPADPDPSTAKGHLIECSPHRKPLMPLYQCYVLASAADEQKLALDALLRPLYGSAYCLNAFVFSEFPEIDPPIHPLGVDAAPGAIWTAQNADLSRAAVFNLAASGKTALCFQSELLRRREGSGPRARIGITSAGESFDFVKQTGLYVPDQLLTYDDVKNFTEPRKLRDAIVPFEPDRVVIVDFGGRGSASADLKAALGTIVPHLPILKVVVASEPRVLTVEQKAGMMTKVVQSSQGGGPVRSNASGQRVAAIQGTNDRPGLGEEKYFSDFMESWTTFRDRGAIPGLEIRYGKGIDGADGVEGIWKGLCDGKQNPRVGTVVRLG